jgi:hypothetical protein
MTCRYAARNGGSPPPRTEDAAYFASQPRGAVGSRQRLAAWIACWSLAAAGAHAEAQVTARVPESGTESSAISVVAAAAAESRQAAAPTAVAEELPAAGAQRVERQLESYQAPADPSLADSGARLRPYRPLTTVKIDAALPPGVTPSEENMEPVPGLRSPEISDLRLESGWGLVDYAWSPTLLCHRPLYFEQTNLERFGYTVGPCLQPVVSGAHFFATIPALPYKMTIDRPRDCISTLGHYRPGNRVPRQWHGLPLRADAATVEAATVVGLVLLLP